MLGMEANTAQRTQYTRTHTHSHQTRTIFLSLSLRECLCGVLRLHGILIVCLKCEPCTVMINNTKKTKVTRECRH